MDGARPTVRGSGRSITWRLGTADIEAGHGTIGATVVKNKRCMYVTRRPRASGKPAKAKERAVGSQFEKRDPRKVATAKESRH